jgi:Sec-independent protein secretion pathway component TatC
MWFSIGIGELGVVGVLLLVVGALALFHLPAWRWMMIGCVSVFVAAVLSPADPVSTLLLGTVLFLFFTAGVVFQRRRFTAVA